MTSAENIVWNAQPKKCKFKFTITSNKNNRKLFVGCSQTNICLKLMYPKMSVFERFSGKNSLSETFHCDWSSFANELLHGQNSLFIQKLMKTSQNVIMS